MIYAAARGPKQLWVVPRAFHTAAYSFEPEEFRRRVLSSLRRTPPRPIPLLRKLASLLAPTLFPGATILPQTKKAASAALASTQACLQTSVTLSFSPLLLLSCRFFLVSLFFFPSNFFPLFSASSVYGVYPGPVGAPSALNFPFFNFFNSKHPTSVPFSVFQFPFSTFSPQCTGCCRASHSWLSRRTVSRRRTASAAIVSSRCSPPCGSLPAWPALRR